MPSTRRLADVDRLEAALERGVLLDVLLVLVERGRADGAQLAAGEHRLEQVGGVDRALGGAGADDRVQLVHEQDDLALGVLDLLQDGLQALLELAAVLGAGEQGADVERDDLAVAQGLGDVAGDDPLGEALDDRGLADAGLADQHRVVLGAAGEDLDHAADLVVAADDRVELAVLGGLREVAAELLQRLVLLLGALVGDAVRAADRLDRPRALSSRRCGEDRASPACAASASRMCSVEMYSSLSLPASRSAARRTSSSSRLVARLVGAGGDRRAGGRARRRARCGSRPGRRRACAGRGRRRSRAGRAARRAGARARSRCCGGRPRPRIAACSASWDLIVKRSSCMRVPKSQSG